MTEREKFIAVFDSGIGGLSVLESLVSYMPQENFIYFGDCANAPYGTKSTEEVRRLTFAVYGELKKRDVKATVIACNTATSAAARELRERYPEDIIVGVEPALKPATLVCEHPTVAVLATPLTLGEEKFAALTQRYSSSARVIPFPCPGLVEFAERGELHSEALRCYLSELLLPLTYERLDAIVLGCTHYPFLRDEISRVLGEDIPIFDGSDGTARQTKKRLEERGLLREGRERGRIIFTDSNYPGVENPEESNVTRFGGKYL